MTSDKFMSLTKLRPVYLSDIYVLVIYDRLVSFIVFLAFNLTASKC